MITRFGSDATHLRVDTVQAGDTIRFVLTGELDLASVDLLEARVRDCREIPADHIVFDLSGVAFMDSAGLRLLLTLRNEAMRRRQQMSLVPGQRAVRRLFDLTRTQGLFGWVTAEADAEPLDDSLAVA
jgi:anti-sigma B factor antagonist